LTKGTEMDYFGMHRRNVFFESTTMLIGRDMSKGIRGRIVDRPVGRDKNEIYHQGKRAASERKTFFATITRRGRTSYYRSLSHMRNRTNNHFWRNVAGI